MYPKDHYRLLMESPKEEIGDEKDLYLHSLVADKFETVPLT